MKKLLLTFTITLLFATAFSQVAINTDGSQPDSSAMLDVKSSTKGLLIPRMTTTQRDSITSPAQGLMVYNTDDSTFYYYKNSSWVKIGHGASGWNKTGNYIYTLNDSVGIGTSSPGAPLEVHGRISQTGTGRSVFLGEDAGKNDDLSEKDNVFVGYYAGNANTTGDYNTANGSFTLCNNTTGFQNTATGARALSSNTTGFQNTATGASALSSNTTGYHNTANGTYSLFNNTTGSCNTATGYHTLSDNTTGTDNTANGYYALSNNTTGSNNTAIGKFAILSNTTGSDNTANGNEALFSNTTGSKNTASGSYALFNNTTGSDNSVLGSYAFYNNKTGFNNVIFGNSALTYDSCGSNNIAIGYQSGYYNFSGSGNIFLGYKAGYNETGSNKLYIDNSDTTAPLIGGDFSTDQVDINGTIKITGGSPGTGKILSSDASGNASWVDGTTVNGGGWTVSGNYIYNTSDSVGIGTSTPHAPLEVHGRISQTGTGNSVFLGENAGENDNLNYNGNVFIGTQAGYLNTSGYGNTATGRNALRANTTGCYNVALGVDALTSSTNAWNNTAIGSGALQFNTTGRYNVANGSGALYNNVTGYNNVAVGLDALDSTNANNNTAVGYMAGYSNKTGTNNIFLGYEAGYYETGSNKLYIDNSNTSTPLIGGDFSADRVDINGTIKITGGSPGDGKILKSDASGNASWVDGVTINGGGWTVNSNYIYNTSDSVGIGTSTPHAPLEVHGRISQTGTGKSVFLGEDAGKSDDLNDNRNVFIGYKTGFSNTEGNSNIAIGRSSLYNNNSGDANISIGEFSLYTNLTGFDNIAIGISSLHDNTGNHNLALGYRTLHDNTSGHYNIAVGSYALDSVTGNNNTAFGFMAGGRNKNGNNNVFLGYQAGYNETGSDKLYIANSNTSNPLIYGEFDNNILKFNGKVGINTTPSDYQLEVSGSTNISKLGGTSYGVYGELNSTVKGDYAIYGNGMQSDGVNGDGYGRNHTLGGVKGYNFWGNPYTFAVSGFSYLDYNRSGGTFGSNNSGNDWGCLAYKNSGGTVYGGYFTSSTTGTGKNSGVKINNGIGAYGELFGADIHGDVYGAFIEGQNYALYTNGNVYKNGLDVHLQKDDKGNNEILYTNVSTDATVQTTGYATISNGKGQIVFDKAFTAIVSDKSPIIVTATPTGESKGVYITNVTKEGFTITENENGKSNITVSYIAIGKRKGYENPSLDREVVSAGYAQKVKQGLHNDNDTRTNGKGLYYENGRLTIGRHPLTLPQPGKPAMENEHQY